MKQQTSAVADDKNASHEKQRKPMRRDIFLATMERVVSQGARCDVVEPHYPKAGNGRAFCRFVGVCLGCERVPDTTTLLKFRRLLETHGLGAALFAKVGELLQALG